MNQSFCIQKDKIVAVPFLPYSMEFAVHTHLALQEANADCIAVQLPQSLEKGFLRAASRLPDISVIKSSIKESKYFLAEPCDASFEALRYGLEHCLPSFCIEQETNYPLVNVPDSYAVRRLGMKKYFKACTQRSSQKPSKRISCIARRLKELSFSFDKVFFLGHLFELEAILEEFDKSSFPKDKVQEEKSTLYSLSDRSMRENMLEFGWMSVYFEEWRTSEQLYKKDLPDRQKLLYRLYLASAEEYQQNTRHDFPNYLMRHLMKFSRNYCLLKGRLMPDLFLALNSAKCCVNHNFAYEVWERATNYPFHKNTDNLPVLDLSSEELWGKSKKIHFHLKAKGRKNFHREHRRRKEQFQFELRGAYSLCSYPKEDGIIENFGKYLQKKGQSILQEASARTIPFSSSLEDGIDSRESIRHWQERKLYVKAFGKPQGQTGSIVVIFDEDDQEHEKFPWCMTWLGEHSQESDMAFYASSMGEQIIGPGISQCTYGGFMMSYPPRRMMDVWQDPDYSICKKKSELLLMAAIDYSVESIIVYVAAKAPKSSLKDFARRFGKRVVYLPIGQISPILVNKIRNFHVLDSHERRSIADDYIF